MPDRRRPHPQLDAVQIQRAVVLIEYQESKPEQERSRIRGSISPLLSTFALQDHRQLNSLRLIFTVIGQIPILSTYFPDGMQRKVKSAHQKYNCIGDKILPEWKAAGGSSIRPGSVIDKKRKWSRHLTRLDHPESASTVELEDCHDHEVPIDW